MKKLLLFIIFFCLPISFFALDNTTDNINLKQKKLDLFWQSKLRPAHILDITIEPGIGIYLGLFREHLQKDGAYIVTPTFDLYLSLYIIKYFGFQAMISSGCVIHPKSTPIEGTILYMAIECFGIYEWKYIFLKAFAGVGYEHPTWLMQQYASGFFEGGATIGAKINDYLAITTSCKVRMGFLHIVDLYPERLLSLTISAGITCRIANRMR